MTRAEKETRLMEIRGDLRIARKAMRDIATGKKQSYGVGTRNAAAYAMSLTDLRSWIADLEKQESELSADLSGRSRRVAYRFQPRY